MAAGNHRAESAADGSHWSFSTTAVARGAVVGRHGRSISEQRSAGMSVCVDQWWPSHASDQPSNWRHAQLFCAGQTLA